MDLQVVPVGGCPSTGLYRGKRGRRKRAHPTQILFAEVFHISLDIGIQSASIRAELFEPWPRSLKFCGWDTRIIALSRAAMPFAVDRSAMRKFQHKT